MRILIAVTDAGAGYHLAEVARLVAARPDVEMTVMLDGPARDIFAGTRGVDRARLLDLSAADADDKRARVSDRITEIAPDLVIAGLSYAHETIDCWAMNAQANRQGRTALLLDDRGPIPPTIAAPPTVVLATSSSVAAWAQANVCPDVQVVGSLKHLSLRDVAWPQLRQAQRRAHGLADADVAVSFFAQELALPDYAESVRSLLACLSQLAAEHPSVTLKLRISLHPAHRGDRGWYEAAARDAGLDVEVWDLASVEASAASDIAVSVCSTALLEAAYCSGVFDFAHPLAVYFMPSERTRDWYRNATGGAHPVLVDEGGAVFAGSEYDFLQTCRAFILNRSTSSRASCNRSGAGSLPDESALLDGIGLPGCAEQQPETCSAVSPPSKRAYCNAYGPDRVD